MADKKFKITIKGTGLDFDRSVDMIAATRIMSFVMTGSALPDNGGSGGGNNSGSGDSAGAGGASGANRSGLNPKQFVAQKKPKTQYERIACLGYFLHTARRTAEFGTEEIKAINKEAAQQPISNLPQIVNDTTRKYGFLSAASDRNKQMTVLGDAVVEALPDREAVKAAIAASRPRKKRKRAVKKKK